MNRLTLINRSSAARVVILLVVIALYGSLFGCAATQVALSKRNLDVQTRTSTAIFVDPVARSKRTIYLQVRSGVMEFDRRAFKRFIKEQFAANEAGYRIVDNPNKAQSPCVGSAANFWVSAKKWAWGQADYCDMCNMKAVGEALKNGMYGCQLNGECQGWACGCDAKQCTVDGATVCLASGDCHDLKNAASP